ncbi:hypothetical protein CQ018_10490 [Arthrobacter sp. MYb227]|uniref:hypothetical protein n=1 Tax=Arthrobacter sp. MYb227 TaxID=1848601 RepID=UPI000CFAF778|nr:hypothetical protein [Arthrobacter sp. MYb227]PQZ92897.1 hypothetical protein CQ018_10490 [Arthrobacter sp. MYb227]
MSTLTTTGRPIASAILLAVEVVLAILAVMLHYAFIAEYGITTDNSFQGLIWGLTSGLSGIAIGVVAIAATIAFLVSSKRSMRLATMAVLVMTLIAMFAVTPFALQQKIGG